MSVPRPALWFWSLAVVLMLAEFLLFDRMTSRHHANIYPRWNDQIQYLTEAYRAYEQSRAHGFLSGLHQALSKVVPQGSLHDSAALVVFTLVGSASRSAALSLNMLVFLAWQAALLFTLPRLTSSRVMGWLGFGLLLCVAWPWSGAAGSAVDFRLDHAAMCLFGISLCAALLTEGFVSLRWSLVFGLMTGLTLAERFLTGAYYAPIFVLIALWLLCQRDRWRRLRNLCIAATVAATVAAPFFWISRTAIYNYYWIGHITGAESSARFRGFDLGHSIGFIFGHLGDMHLGLWFGWTVVAVTILLALFVLLGPRKLPESGISYWVFLSLAFLLTPAAILVFHKQKSEFVLGVLVPGAITFTLWVWASLWCRLDLAAHPRRWRHLALLPVLIALSSGAWFFTKRQLASPHTVEFMTSARRVNLIADHIFDASRTLGLTHPYIGIDQVVDFIDAPILQVICYERKKVWIPFVIQLPDSILADKDEVMFYRLQLCDFIALTDEMPGDGYWPYDKQMRRLYPQFKTWCEAHRQPVASFQIFDRRMTLYQRKPRP